jgi:hypothetical protein
LALKIQALHATQVSGAVWRYTRGGNSLENVEAHSSPATAVCYRTIADKVDQKRHVGLASSCGHHSMVLLAVPFNSVNILFMILQYLNWGAEASTNYYNFRHEIMERIL